METTQVCNLVFSTSLGGTRIVRMPNPRENLAPPMVQVASGRIIAANPFDEGIGALVELKDAQRITTSVRHLI